MKLVGVLGGCVLRDLPPERILRYHGILRGVYLSNRNPMEASALSMQFDSNAYPSRIGPHARLVGETLFSLRFDG